MASAGNLQGIGSAMSAADGAAAAPTTGVVRAAANEVSALTATQFAAHAQMYQAVRWGKHTDHTKQDVRQTQGASDRLAMVWACESLVRRVDARSLMTYMMVTIER
jgi:hypothetical protein